MGYVAGKVITLQGKRLVPSDPISDAVATSIPHLHLLMKEGKILRSESAPADLKSKAPKPEAVKTSPGTAESPPTPEGGDSATKKPRRGRRGSAGK